MLSIKEISFVHFISFFSNLVLYYCYYTLFLKNLSKYLFVRSYISDIVGANDDDGGDGEDDNDDYVHC